jgi:hypothetical protein
MTFVRWVETVGLGIVFMLALASYQMTDYQHEMEAKAEHAELLYLRAWKGTHDNCWCVQDSMDWWLRGRNSVPLPGECSSQDWWFEPSPAFMPRGGNRTI